MSPIVSRSVRGLTARRVTAAVGLLLLTAAGASPAAAQGGVGAQDSTRTRQDVIRARLRSAQPLIRPDTLGADSLTADSVRAAATADSVRRAQAVTTVSDAQRDSIMNELLRLSGFVFTEYKAQRAHFDSDSSRLDLRETAEVVREGQRLAADTSIVFSQETSIACAYGKPTLSGQGVANPITADSLCFNVDTQLGMARGARTEFTEGANWIVHSRETFMRGDTAYTHDGIFTDCNLEEPHYHFAAKELKVIRGDILVARSVTFNFQDVPVFWLPFFAQSMKQGRRSGILTPRFGINDIFRNRSDYSRTIEDVGFFWAISDHFGAETSVDWRSGDYTSMRGTLDFRFLRQFLAGSVTYRNFWKSEGGRDFTVGGRGDWQPDERTRLNANVSYATSTRFVRQRTIDPRELRQSIQSSAGLSRRFDWASLSVGMQRDQFLNDNTVNATLPSVGLNLPSVTLFASEPGEEKFYSNATWTGTANSTRRIRRVDDALASPGARGQTEISSSLSSSFTMGRFSLSQDVQLRDVTDLARNFPADTLMPLPERTERRMSWGTGINFQQRLIGSTTFTPGLRLRGELLEGDTTGGDRVAAPTRIDFSAQLRTDLYGFIRRGIGPVEAIRHKLSPSFTYTYSPEPTITDRQREVFRIGEIQEQNRLTIGLSQTFEARMRQSTDTTDRPAPAGPLPPGRAQPGDTTGLTRADTTGLPSATDPNAPRRRETVRPINLLSISTDAVVYDFVRAREDGEGIQTLEIGNSIQSDLLRGLQFSFAHDLFEEIQADSAAGIEKGRRFAPHLSRVSASFSLSADSWLARKLGLGRSAEQQQQDQATRQQAAADSAARADSARVPEVTRSNADFGVLGRGAQREAAPRQPAGTWNASFNYTMFRPREGEGGLENQMLTASLSFQPTLNWGVHWNTGYNFTEGEFTDHILTLTRQLHDWDANFDFVKAQNGNFSFQFRVQLRANPDIKLDYEQRDVVQTSR
ncbi:MAG: hypothetical protein L0271_05635 [Gemmatimonadetes bacterium]|nr:hypothetical protein [Gemmatimonadota bacterium]